MKGKKVIILVVVMLAAFSYLLLIGMKEGSMYYLEVSEYLARARELGNRKVRVNGRVVKESLDFNTKTLTLRFILKDTKGNESLPVVYHGSPPDLLNQDGVTAVAEGHYDLKNNVFIARQLLVKCPSKYERKDKGV
ncbi:MAG TPA: cytochrome c maturation protein CcmE [Nitrospirae bacterium]|nr:cytochrome c maturation protein CcmE [Nitrospirota bacterium]